MDTAWLILSGVVKLLFAVSPAFARAKDFGLGQNELWKEAKEVATVAGTRGMLASLPALLLFQTLEKADYACSPSGIQPLHSVAAFVVWAFFTTLLLIIPVTRLRSSVFSFMLVLILVLLEGVFMFKLRDELALGMCATAHPHATIHLPESRR